MDAYMRVWLYREGGGVEMKRCEGSRQLAGGVQSEEACVPERYGGLRGSQKYGSHVRGRCQRLWEIAMLVELRM